MKTEKEGRISAVHVMLCGIAVLSPKKMCNIKHERRRVRLSLGDA